MNFRDLSVAKKLWATILSIVIGLSAAAFYTKHLSDEAHREALSRVELHDARIQDALRWRGTTNAGVHAVVSKALTTEKVLNDLLGERVKHSIANSKEVYARISAVADTPREKAALDTVAQARQRMIDLTGQVEKIKGSNDAGALEALVEQQLKPAAEQYLQCLDDFVALQQALRDETRAAALAHAERVGLFSWLVVTGVLGASMLIAMMLSRSITRPLAEVVQAAQAIAKGDLTRRVRSDRRDEIGQLMQAMGQMSQRLHSLVFQVREGVESVSTASSQIASGNQDLSSRTEQMAASLQETASSMEELTATVSQSAETARMANQMAVAAAQSASLGGASVDKVVASMARISEGSKRIADIISTVDSIAFQTNILALNAAVEAARAGEAGRGFAVVAGEVRTLAQRSADAAKEIKRLIDNSVEAVDSGSDLVAQTGATMRDIVVGVKRVSDLIGEIAGAAGEQRDGIAQVNTAVGSLDRVTQQNAALVEESAAAADSLRQQAQRLAQIVAVFQLEAAHGRGRPA